MRHGACRLVSLFAQKGEMSGWKTPEQRDRGRVASTGMTQSDMAAERQGKLGEACGNQSGYPWQGGRCPCKTVLGRTVKEAESSRTVDCLDTGGKREKSCGILAQPKRT